MKEKIYEEYGLGKKHGLDEATLLDKLKKVRREIKKQIRDERLHPDKWPSDLNNKEKPKRLEKYLYLMQIVDFLKADIQRGYIVFDNHKKEPKQPRAIEL